MKSLWFLAGVLLASGAAAQNTRDTTSSNPFDLMRNSAQAPAMLRVPVTVAFSNEPLETALREIARQAGVGLSYAPDLPGLARRVNLQATDLEAAEAFLRVLRGSGLDLLAARNGKMVALRIGAPGSSTPSTGLIRGVVREAGTGAPLRSVDVSVPGTNLRVISSAEGVFRVPRVPAGVRSIEVGLLGYGVQRVDSIRVEEGGEVSVEVALTPVAIPLTEVVVAPGHFGIAHEAVGKAQTLTREQIETLPQLGEDIYRAVNRLPGISSNEMKAKFTVRGGTDESLLVTLDGLELLEPFHLKDFDGSLSIIDVAAIGGVDLSTGGFGAEFGNRLTGLFQLKTTNRMVPRPQSSIGLSLSNARVMSQGSFADGNGLWLLSARRGYLDILLRLIDESGVDPRYYDALAKVVYQVSPRHRIAARILRAGDKGEMVDDDGVGTLNSGYGSTYAWLTWSADLSDRFKVETLFSVGGLDWKRNAEESGNGPTFEVADTRDLRFTAVRQDWQASVSDRLLLKWGIELRRSNAEYDYFSMNRRFEVVAGNLVTRFDTITAGLSPSGDQVGLYLAQRTRPWNALTVETGLRWDRQSHTSEDQVSPRINAALAIDRNTTARAAWGRYAQPHALHQLGVQDGESSFATAERAEQIVLGLERSFGSGLTARVEAYRRNEWNLRPRFLNLFSYIEPVSEVEGDRVRLDPRSARAEGVELFAQRKGSRSSWSASYALARVKDVFDDFEAPRQLDQQHTFYFDYNIAPSAAWRVSWSWQYHTGWPITPATFVVDTLNNGNINVRREFGAYNSARLSPYHRLDLRITRDWSVGRGRLAVFLDIFNLYDRKNPQAYNHDVSYINGRLGVNRTVEPLLPRLPTVGATFQF